MRSQKIAYRILLVNFRRLKNQGLRRQILLLILVRKCPKCNLRRRLKWRWEQFPRNLLRRIIRITPSLSWTSNYREICRNKNLKIGKKEKIKKAKLKSKIDENIMKYSSLGKHPQILDLQEESCEESNPHLHGQVGSISPGNSQPGKFFQISEIYEILKILISEISSKYFYRWNRLRWSSKAYY